MNELDVRFRFYILAKVVPTVRPGLAGTVPSRLAFCEIFKINSSLMMHCCEIVPSRNA